MMRDYGKPSLSKAGKEGAAATTTTRSTPPPPPPPPSPPPPPHHALRRLPVFFHVGRFDERKLHDLKRAEEPRGDGRRHGCVRPTHAAKVDDPHVFVLRRA